MFVWMREKGEILRVAGLHTDALWGDFIIRQDKQGVFLSQNCGNPDKFPWIAGINDE